MLLQSRLGVRLRCQRQRRRGECGRRGTECFGIRSIALLLLLLLWLLLLLLPSAEIRARHSQRAAGGSSSQFHSKPIATAHNLNGQKRSAPGTSRTHELVLCGLA